MTTKAPAPTSARAQSERSGSRPTLEAIRRPFEVHVDAKRRGRFEDLDDAIGSARIAKWENPGFVVVVTDALAGRTVLEIDGGP
jgi:hypothetical protein